MKQVLLTPCPSATSPAKFVSAMFKLIFLLCTRSY